MFGAQNEVKIADLGLAKRLLRPSGGSEDINASVRREQLTMRRGENMIQGTPAYLAPEMALTPDQVDIRADLYSLGVTAYQLLTGQLPFDAKDPMQVMMKHVTEPVVPPRTIDREIPESLQAVVLKLMEKKPHDRYQTAKEVVSVASALE
jgi:serine/threonine-protein kinase